MSTNKEIFLRISFKHMNINDYQICSIRASDGAQQEAGETSRLVDLEASNQIFSLLAMPATLLALLAVCSVASVANSETSMIVATSPGVRNPALSPMTLWAAIDGDSGGFQASYSAISGKSLL